VAWYHVAATIASTSVPAVLYINGASISVTSTAGGGAITNITTSEPVRIAGKGGTDFTQYHDGKIDDVRIYNRALTAAEIAGIYASGRD
jgi:hypothetical protein